MSDERERDLQSPVKRDRLDGWRSVEWRSRLTPELVGPRERRRLLDLACDEPDPDVWRAAVNSLLRLLPLGDEEEPDTPAALGDWLWAPFHQTSLVLRGVDSDRRRDEVAVIDLGRHLSRKDFPQTSFLAINPRDPQWEKTVGTHEARAILVVGRLGLYGPQVQELLGRPGLRFAFPGQKRPALRRGQLDPVYHAVRERDRDEPYRTHEDANGRTDYGLVQRYPLLYKDREIIVVVCAGASSLGTLAAVRWAAWALTEPDLRGHLVPAPTKVATESVLEALVEVRAAGAPYPQDWQPMRLDLLGLYVDDSKWCPEDDCWYPAPPQAITVVRHPEGPDRAPAVFFDDSPSRFRNRDDNLLFRLLVCLCELADQSEDGRVGLAALAQQVWPAAPDPNLLRKRLAQLKQIHLGEALHVNDATVTLRCRVRFEP